MINSRESAGLDSHSRISFCTLCNSELKGTGKESFQLLRGFPYIGLSGMEGFDGKGGSSTPPLRGSPPPQTPAAPEEGLKGREIRQKSRSASLPEAAQAARQEGVRSAMSDKFDVGKAVQDLQELHKYGLLSHCSLHITTNVCHQFPVATGCIFKTFCTNSNEVLWPLSRYLLGEFARC